MALFRIATDANGQVISMQFINEQTGVPIANNSSIVLAIGDIEGDGTQRHASFQVLRWKDANNNCAPMKAFVLMTTPEVDSG